MKIKFKKLHPDAQLPTKSEGNIGWDLYYCGEDKEVYQGEQHLFETGISWEPEEGYHGLIWDRSGLAAKYQLHRLAGVIDCVYRGEIKVVIKAFSHHIDKAQDYKICGECGSVHFPMIYTDGIALSVPITTIKKGDRIAQLIIQQEVPTEVEWAEDLAETERGEGGFGSTGR